MGLETASYISQLNTSNPAASDAVGEADDHLKLIKTVLKTSFPSGTTQPQIPNNSGQSGKFLTTNGTDNSWGTVDAGGGLVLISTATNASAVSSINFTDCFSSTYDINLIVLQGISVVSGSSNLQIGIGNSDLSSLQDLAYRIVEEDAAGNTTTAIAASGESGGKVSHAQAAGITTQACSAQLWVFNAHNSATATRIIGTSSYFRASHARSQVMVTATSAASNVSFKLSSTSGNIGNSGLTARVSVYGLAES